MRSGLPIEKLHIPESAKDSRNTQEFHSHLEGVLYPSQLFAIAEHTDVGLVLDENLKKDISRVFEQAVLNSKDPEKRNLINFINRLSTRWMRLFHAMIILDSSSPEESRRRQERFEELCVEANLEQVYQVQKQTVNNQLVSPFNVTGRNGDLGGTKIKDLISGRLIKQEKSIYEALLNKRNANPDDYENHTRTWFEYCETVAKIADQYEERARREGRQFKVIKTLSLRRSEVEQYFLQAIEEVFGEKDHKSIPQKIVEKIHELFCKGIIDIVDICGVESDEQYLMENMFAFLTELANREVMLSAHAGELIYLIHRKWGRKNLQSSLSLKVLKIIAHAVRILDQRNADLFQLASELGIIIAWNPSSNENTNLTSDIDHHTFVRNFKRIVSSAIISVITTDDHAAISPIEDQLFLQKEVEKTVDAILKWHKGEFTRNEIEEILDGHSYLAFNKTQTDVVIAREKSQLILARQELAVGSIQ